MLQDGDSNQPPENADDSGQLVPGGINFSSSGEINIRVDSRVIGECMVQGLLQRLNSTEARRDRILAHELSALERWGIFPDEIDSAGKANKLLNKLQMRRAEGLTTPKQIRFLEGRGFQHVGTWDFEAARRLIDRIAAQGWRMPPGIDPATYVPE